MAPYFASPPGASRTVGLWAWLWTAGLALAAEDIQKELDRRRPGQSHASTARQEADQVEILSGVFEGRTTGTPISLLVWNMDANSSAYDLLRDHRGGGRASARETVGRVAAGAVAKKLLPAAGVKGAKKAKVPGYDGQLGPLDEGTLPKCYLIWA